MILVAFTLAAGAFFYQIDRYAKEEKEEQLKATAASIAELTTYAVKTGDMLNIAVLDVSLKSTANQDQMSILIANPDGQVLMSVEPDSRAVLTGKQIPMPVVRELTRAGNYSETGTLGALFRETNYIVGTLCEDTDGTDMALVFVAASTGTCGRYASAGD